MVRAITAANNNTTANGRCRKGSGADTIVLPNGSTQRLTSRLPVIRSNISIAGNNSTIRRAASAPAFGIFAVGVTGDLTLRRTTVSGGTTGVSVSTSRFSSGSASLINSTISGNVYSGVSTAGEYAGFLTVTNSTISDNGGSGIDFYGGVHLTNSTVSNNGGDGVIGDFLEMINSTISGNAGCGVDCSGCLEIDLTNTTVTGNGGGGVYFETHNQQTAVTLTRTVIAGNTGVPAGAEVFNNNASVTAGSFNLFGHSRLTNDQAFENFTPGPTDITATSNGKDPTALVNILNPTLANNSGPTRTHALVAGSPAVDAINNGTCSPSAQDQRGVRRPQDGDNDGAAICDTGAFERR